MDQKIPKDQYDLLIYSHLESDDEMIYKIRYVCLLLFTQILSNYSTYLGYFDQLIIIIMPIEEWLLTEYLHTISTKRLPRISWHHLKLHSNLSAIQARICQQTKVHLSMKNTIIETNTWTMDNGQWAMAGQSCKFMEKQVPSGQSHNSCKDMCSCKAQHGTWKTRKVEFGEDTHHSSKHATKAPQVQRIVIVLQINKKFWAFKVSAYQKWKNGREKKVTISAHHQEKWRNLKRA